MCKESKSKKRLTFPKRFQVGDITDDKDEYKYTLLSEGRDPEGMKHCIWVRSRNHPLCSIERITQDKNGDWGYQQEFLCDILECATATYLKMVNPNTVYDVG